MAYAYWEAALRGEKPKMFVDHPECGFYRMGVYEKQDGKARKRVGWTPVAIFPLGGLLTAVIGTGRSARTESDRDRVNDLWSYVAANPISEATYRAVAERGEPWPDSHVASIPVANSSMTLTPREAAAATDGTVVWNKGHPEEGQPIGEDEFKRRKSVMQAMEVDDRPVQDKISRDIDEGLALLAGFGTIDSDEMAAKARSLQEHFLVCRGFAEKQYEAANRPLLDEQKRIRSIWFPIRDKADEGSNALRKAMGAWEDSKRQAAKVAAERAAAGQEVKSNVPPPATQIRGGAGRAASVRVEKIVESIDVEKVFAQFRDSPVVIECLTKIAQQAVRAGIDVPGAVVTERSIVK